MKLQEIYFGSSGIPGVFRNCRKILLSLKDIPRLVKLQKRYLRLSANQRDLLDILGLIKLQKSYIGPSGNPGDY